LPQNFELSSGCPLLWDAAKSLAENLLLFFMKGEKDMKE